MRTEFADVFGNTVREGDLVATVSGSYANPTLVVGEVERITAARIFVRNRPHAGWPHRETFRIDDSLNRVVRLSSRNPPPEEAS